MGDEHAMGSERGLEPFAAAFEGAAVGMALVGADGRPLEANAALRRMLGYGREELLGMRFSEFTHPDDVAEDEGLFAELLAGTRGSYRIEKRFVRKGGEAMWGRLGVSLVGEGARGGSSLVVAVVEDVTDGKRAEEGLRASEERFRAVIDQAPLAVHVFAPDGLSLRTNPAWDELWGEPPAEGANVFEDELLAAAGLLPYLMGGAAGAGAGTPPLAYDPARVGRKGEPRWLRAFVYPVLDGTGDVREVALVLEDVTERRRAEGALEESEGRLRAVVDNAPVVLFALDPEGVFTLVAGRGLGALGTDPASTVGRSVFDVHAERPDIVENSRRALRGEEVAETVELGGVTFDCRYSPLRDGAGRPSGAICVATDVTESKRLEEELARRAFHDPLTGLANRDLLTDRLEHALRRAERRGARVAVLFMDLDDFKVVNDNLGHEAGDELLVAVAGRLKGRVRPEDTVARLGGDEFVVLLEDVGGAEDAKTTAERILSGLEAPFELDGGQEAFARASIGISLKGGPGSGASSASRPGDLLREADLALYRAKEKGRGRHELFEPSMGARAAERLSLGNGLRRALQREELVLHHQPELSLATGNIVTVEALVRWEHPERGLLLPGEFVPLAEETGLIVPIGRWVLKEACRQARGWQERRPPAPGSPPLSVAVNVSARQFHDPGLAASVREALEASGLPAGSLVLEITEGALLEEPEAAAALEGLKGLGVRLVIDDFGTGYSSLSRLRRLGASGLKIDRSFVEGLSPEGSGGNDEDAAVVSAIVGLGRALGLELVAEGVETAAQLARVGELGCDLAQGFHLHRPMPAGELSALLEARTA